MLIELSAEQVNIRKDTYMNSTRTRSF